MEYKVVRRPLTGLAVMVGVGTGMGLSISSEWTWPAIIGCWIAVFFSLMLLFPSKQRHVSCYILFFLLSMTNALLVQSHHSREVLSTLIKTPSAHVSVKGYVCNQPAGYQIRDAYMRYVFRFKTKALKRLERWEPCESTIHVSMVLDKDAQTPCYGDGYMLTGILTRSDRDRNNRVYRTPAMRVENHDAKKDASCDAGSTWIKWCLAIRSYCAGKLEHGLFPIDSSYTIVQALLLGYRENITSDLKTLFAHTGTLHIFAISGAHVFIILLFIRFVLKTLGVSRHLEIWFIIPLLCVYAVITGLSISVIRASLIAVIIAFSLLVSKRVDGISALSFVFVLIVLWDPEQLFSLAFLFSFTAFSGLLLSCSAVYHTLYNFTKREEWTLEKEPRWKRNLRQGVRYVILLFFTSCAVWLATAPLTAYYFNMFSPVSIITNMVVIPGATLIMLTGLLSIIFGSCIPYLSAVFNHANSLFVDSLLWVVERAADVKHGHIYVESPSLYAALVWYLLCITGCLCLRKSLLWTLVCLLGAGCFAFNYYHYHQTFHVDIIDVGQGNATLVTIPHKPDVLIDTGSRRSGYELIRHLKKKGINRLRCLILSHPDAQHVGAAADIMDTFQVDELWCSAYAGRSKVYRDTIAKAEKLNIPIHYINQSLRTNIVKEVDVEIWVPDYNQSIQRSDNACMVIRVAKGVGSVMLMGDADTFVTEQIISQQHEVSADIYVSAQHGKAGATDPNWLSLVQPKTAVISVGVKNLDGCPDQGELAILKENGRPTYRTDECGTLRIDFHENRPCEVIEGMY